MDKRKLLIIIGSVVLVIIIVTVIILMQKCSKDDIDIEEDLSIGDSNSSLTDQRRLNILKLAESYALAGEYDRALNLIDGILIENPDDEDARALQRAILSMDRSGGADAFMEAQQRLLEQQIRQTQALVNNMQNNRNNNLPSSSSSSSVHSGQSAAEIAAATAAAREAEAARRAAEQEAAAIRRAAEQEAAAARRAAELAEQQRLLDAVNASLQSAADSSQGISSGAESVQFYDNLPDLD